MYNGINRNSKLFTPELCDELNNSFSKTLEKIEQFHPKDLETKYSASDINITPIANVDIRNNSFNLDKEHWINVVISTKESLTDVDVASISGVEITDTVFVQFVMKNTVKGKVSGSIRNGILHAYGTLEANTDYLVSSFFVA